MAWQLSIAHPIYNRAFRYRKIVETTINGNVSAGASTITIDQPTGCPNAANFFGRQGTTFIPSKLDKIVIGPSSDSSNVGAVEELLVSGTSLNTITPVKTITYDYLDNDPITLYGTAMPDGWVCSSGSEKLFGLLHELNAGVGYGKNDMCSLTIPVDLAASSSWKMSLDIGRLIPNRYHLLSVFNKTISTENNPVLIKLYENGSASASVTVTPSAANDGVYVENLGIFTSQSTQTASAVIKIEWPSGAVDPIQIDSINLRCGWFQSASGIYNFLDVVVEDINIYDLSDVQTNSLVDGYKIVAPSPDKVLHRIRRGLTCHFDNVSISTQSLFQILQSYITWQNQGYLLSLKTAINELPTYLVGIMSISEVSSPGWSTGSRSFTMKFEEVF